MPGPPKTLISSLELPPLSLMGMTYVNVQEFFSITSLKTSTRLLAALPPENTTILRVELGPDEGFSPLEVGNRDITDDRKDRLVKIKEKVKKGLPIAL